jgi:hypothetical protein
MDRIRAATEELVTIFKTSATKHEANARAGVVMEQLTREPAFLTAILARYLESPQSYNRKHYPVVALHVALNEYFGLVANCWIPLPNRDTNLSTKAIHHHGDMLLTTATLYGPGYEHWMFSLPEAIDREKGLYSMRLLEAAPHPQHHVSFVDAWTAHTPLYPKSLSITLALWSRRFPTTWKDRVKRLPGIRGNEAALSKLVSRVGLRGALQLNVVESFDFYPEGDAFKVMPVREEFGLGPNEDHICSVFHILQETGNEHLARTVKRRLADGALTEARPAVERLLPDLERGRPIDGKLSAGHYDKPFANFTREDILRALGTRGTGSANEANQTRGSHGVELPSATNRQEGARPGPG